MYETSVWGNVVWCGHMGPIQMLESRVDVTQLSKLFALTLLQVIRLFVAVPANVIPPLNRRREITNEA